MHDHVHAQPSDGRDSRSIGFHGGPLDAATAAARFTSAGGWCAPAPGPLSELRSYWFDLARGLRHIAAAGVVWSSAGSTKDATAVAIAVGAALDHAAASGAGVGDNPGVETAAPVAASAASAAAGAATSEATATPAPGAQQLACPPGCLEEFACALLLQPSWRAFCARLGGRPQPPRANDMENGQAHGQCRHGTQQTGPPAAPGPARGALYMPEGASAAQRMVAVRSLSERVAATLHARPAAVMAQPVAALAAACWAQPCVRDACLTALASELCTRAASESAVTAQRLQQLIAMLQLLDCLT
jgi:hypothetical protein